MTTKSLISTLFVSLMVSTAFAQDTNTDWMTFYYKKPSPERFVPEVRALAKKGALSKDTARAPLTAFLSRVMAQNPDNISEWLTELQDLSDSDRKTLLDAAWYSNTDQTRNYLKAAGYGQYLKQPAPDILKLKVDNPSVLDMLWGYFMATGEQAPIRRLISAFNLSKYEGALERYRDSEKTEQDKKEAMLDVTFQAARWSLQANCRQHPLVLKHCHAILVEKDLPKEQAMWLGLVLATVKPSKDSVEIREDVQ